MPFYKEKAANAVLIPIPAATRERNAARFARFCSLLSRRLKITDGFRATWIREDREQMKGTHGLDKLSNLTPFTPPENHRRLPCHMDKGRP